MGFICTIPDFHFFLSLTSYGFCSIPDKSLFSFVLYLQASFNPSQAMGFTCSIPHWPWDFSFVLYMPNRHRFKSLIVLYLIDYPLVPFDLCQTSHRIHPLRTLIQNAMPYSASQTGWRKMNASLEGKKILAWGPGCYIVNTGFLRRCGNFRWRIHSSNRKFPQIKSM
jgi:hypothetical protein